MGDFGIGGHFDPSGFVGIQVYKYLKDIFILYIQFYY